MGSGKWIGAVLGCLVGGPAGAFVGFGVGALLDIAEKRRAEEQSVRDAPPRRTRPGYRHRTDYADPIPREVRPTTGSGSDEFTTCVCVLIAGVLKSDGELHPEEVELVSQRLKENYHFDDAGVRRMMGFITELAQGSWSVEEFALRAKRHLKMAARRNLLYFLLEVAYADGEYVFAEAQVIRVVAAIFGLREGEVSAMESALNRNGLEWAYQVLEVSPDASEDEVKRAFRRQAKLHHPDRVAGQGPVAEETATRRFQAINAAYEEIKKDRNFT